MKLPKIPKLQIKKRTGKPEKIDKKTLKVKKPKKRTLLVLLVVLLILAGLAGVGISKGFLKGFQKGPEAEGQKTEAVHEKQSGGKDHADAADLKNLQGRLGYDFIRTLRSDRYMIKYKTTTVYEGKAYEVETTYAVSGGSIALVSGDRATIVKDDKVYMLNHTDKTMLSWAVDHSSGDLKRIDTEGIAYVESREEKGLVCEVYKTASSGLKLYFNGKTLVRMETNINKLDTVMEILEVSKDVPDSMFAVPSDYQTTNI